MIRYLSAEELLIIAEEALAGTQVVVRESRVTGIRSLSAQCDRLWIRGLPKPACQGRRALQSLVNSHPLIDGNKRLGWLAVATLLELNGYELRHTEDEAYALIMDIAKGTLTEVGDIAGRLA